MIHGLHHAQITVPKGAEEAARRFYCGVLGLPEVEKPEALEGVPVPGYARFDFRDPFGNRVEMIQALPPG